jgi:hypothetical protein
MASVAAPKRNKNICHFHQWRCDNPSQRLENLAYTSAKVKYNRI